MNPRSKEHDPKTETCCLTGANPHGGGLHSDRSSAPGQTTGADVRRQWVSGARQLGLSEN